MSIKTMILDIVSAEKVLFNRDVTMFVVSGQLGELGIYPGHTALLAYLKPGPIKAVLPGGREEIFYISGGFLEIQPYLATVLADTALRATDLDEISALSVKERAEQQMVEKKTGIQYSQALSNLAEATAQLRAIHMFRKKTKRNYL